jgi:penicillin amidase
MLAADPHLPSQIPAIFHRVHLTGGGLDVIGATAAGIPGVLMGHNGALAWGWTNANTDVQDFYVERIHGGTHAEYDGVREPLRIRYELIKVKGADDVRLTVRSTRHGPLLSDLIDPNGPALSLRWAAIDSDDDTGISAWLEANKARNWREFTAAFRRFKSHGQNILYADIEGNIGYLMPGTVPIRAAGDGSAPVPGWTSQYEWTGYVPFDELPRAFNPKQGYLATANNRIAPESYPYTLSNGYAAPYRAQRVLQMISARRRHSLADLENMQGDVLALHARELLPLLQNATPASRMEQRALELLRGWDLRVTAASAASAVFEAWYIQLAESIFADDLGPELWRSYSDQMYMVSMALSSAVHDSPEWCDDRTTMVREGCRATAVSALRKALARMAAAQGSEDVDAWQWGNVHHAVFFHRPFDADPALAKRFNRMARTGGDKHTVNVASNPRWTEYDQRHVALYRQIIDLADFNNSRWMAAPGESGRLEDPHYDDLIEPWRRVEYHPMLFARRAVDEQAVQRELLSPSN